MAAVPRHLFVPPNLQFAAYDNGPLPIGYGQTISQPYIVALMTDLLAVGKNDIVLEVGTGSGYQTAVLSRLVRQVYTLEIVPELAEQAQARLGELGYRNVEVICGNGRLGLPKYASFDAIVVTAAPEQVPVALIDQLKPGGRMVIPVGRRYSGQDLKLIEKDEAGGITVRNILPVAFVPLTGSYSTVVKPKTEPQGKEKV